MIALSILFNKILLRKLYVVLLSLTTILSSVRILSSADVGLAIVFGSSYCQFCKKAEILLKSKKIEYVFIEIDNLNESKFWNFFKQYFKVTTVPQIFINYSHIGGYNDLQHFLRKRAI